MPSAAEHFQGQPTDNALDKSESQKVSIVKHCLRSSLQRENENVAKVTARGERNGSSSGSQIPTTFSGSKKPNARSSTF
ncbi:uncharacterized protein EAF02_006227 [Botrytis sinoallii]|uniref:uncharacterized protein n=1 Tax=Botrytis sinoallii TaxID=1463999 RepID=UPI00190122EC|nr:uncharacterized protein EAF02_006227 [Botrytis sinoallii]KAF7882864.1 hypothetical protein EAF02_006227 [Botrytis sinoallii]